MPDTLGQIVSYYWDFGNGQISTEARPTVTYRNPRKYNVALTVRDAAGKEANFVREGLIKIPPLFTHDAIVFGFLFVILALVFITANSKRPFFQKFYRFVPAILLCYFIPALLNWPFGLISGEFTNAYNPVTSRYLLPASLILLCVSIDFKGIINLGPKALIMFFTATLGIVIGGPIALLLVGSIAPGVVESAGANELWEGLSTIAGSWIGGGANQAAMKEIFEVNERLFSAMVVVDVVVANIWMGFLLYGASISKKVDGWFKADSSAIDDLKNRVENYRASIERNPTTTDYYKILAVAFGGTALAHFGADLIVPLLKPFEQTLLDAG